ncbi:unnamed protein product [Symbiodinium necroappetens]|uniref:Ubiquitin-like domain-containing protein n=1 Tax=Symbiodinium necroappetens TaxID=1628268 RepID=A0A813AE35_9DINO|nr:unnamed protein product [Symbiodinium necroappetens]
MGSCETVPSTDPMADAVRDSGAPVSLAPPTRASKEPRAEESALRDEFKSLFMSTNLDHVKEAWIIRNPWGKAIGTNIRFEAYLIHDALIPPLEVDAPSESGDRDLEVTTMNGEPVTIQIASPYLVSSVKTSLQTRLAVPSLMQKILVGEKELQDSECVPGDVNSVTLLRSEVPRVTTLQFLESMAFCVDDWKDTLFSHWYHFDSCYEPFPDSKAGILEWLSTHKDMKHTAFTAENFLQSFNGWLVTCQFLREITAGGERPNEEQMEKWREEMVHPEASQRDVEKLQGFLEEHCHSPSLFQVYPSPKTPSYTFGHEDDMDAVIFMVGRPKVAPQTLMVGAVELETPIAGE